MTITQKVESILLKIDGVSLYHKSEYSRARKGFMIYFKKDRGSSRSASRYCIVAKDDGEFLYKNSAFALHHVCRFDINELVNIIDVLN